MDQRLRGQGKQGGRSSFILLRGLWAFHFSVFSLLSLLFPSFFNPPERFGRTWNLSNVLEMDG